MAKEAVDDLDLVALDVELRRLVRRARRQRRGAEGGPAQWQAWSGTTDEAFGLVDRIAGTPALGLDGIAVKIGALRWFLEETDAILDAKGLRQLRSLDREARRLTGR